MNTRHRFNRASRPLAAWASAVLALAGLSLDASAQVTDLANTPLITSQPSPVKPNVMFVLDDSGSMGSNFMPDDANFATGKYGFYASQCNGLAYNPATIYTVPVDSTGAEMAAGTYTFPTPSSLANQRAVSTAVNVTTGSLLLQLSGFGNNDYRVDDLITLYSSTDPSQWMVGTITNVNASTDRLTVNFTESNGSGAMTLPFVGDDDFRPFFFTYNTYSGAPKALSYSYSTGSLNTTSTFYQQCNSLVGASPGNGRFTKVMVTATYSDIQNYRNWYTYYRTRMLTMRTAVSQAFKAIDDKFRVGFSTISSEVVDGTKFLDTSDFDATQKSTWYTRLFGSNPSGYTPLRGALSKAGQYYAKAARRTDGTAQVYDPMQLSCQKNFTILTTDGYWNNNDESASYGPLRLDDTTTVGQQDATAARPMRDGSTTTLQQRTSILQERTVSTQVQSATVNLQTRTGGLQTRSTGNGNSGSPTWTPWTSTTSCAWDTSGNSQRQCRYNYNAWTNVPSCTAVSGNTGTSGTWTIPVSTQCQYSAPVYTNVASCTPSSPAPSTGPTNYTVASATVCNTVTTNGSWANVGSCTASATKQCQYTAWTAYSTTASCTATPQSTGPNYTVATARECNTASTGGSSDSLADVAMYYYETDLRTANCSVVDPVSGVTNDVCNNNVPMRGADTAQHQHMTTFTLGLGVNGTLGYHPDYLGGLSPDYQEVIAGTKNWPNPASGSGAVNIDDLWHAAVNGRGQYFSAENPTTLARSLSDTLAAINQLSGTAAAAATTTLQPTPTDNTEFVTSYTTVQWVGDVVAYRVDPETGVRAATSDWSAQQNLDARVAAGTARNIYYMQRNTGTNTGTLRPFTYANLTTDGLNGNFDSACSKTPALTQCTTSGYDVAGANSGSNLVSWLRGQADNARYRSRQHLLSDVVGGAPVYVGKPPFQYTENNYQTFVSNMNALNSGAGRKGVVYVPSNDGMLHAFQASNGQELWAYVPTMVMDRMYRLADFDYANRHEYFVNATPVVGDIWVPGSPGAWKTILVGGLGSGGRGYYALDITDPDNPSLLWEFSNDTLGGNGNLGLTFGNPVITKRTNGTWVVMFTSGYNNASPGDGNGRLFVVNANTGQRVTEIETFTSTGVGAGNTTTPSGLAKINNWVESTRDNTTLRVYGGDLLGNLWRFDIDGVVAPNNAALRLAQLRAGSPAAAQPITTRPELATVTSGGTSYPVVYVGTGKMLGVSDLSTSGQQSVYAIKDPLTNTPLGDVHARSDMVAQTLTVATDGSRSRTVTNNAVDWSSNIGWRVDLPTAGERVNIDMRLALTTLVVGANAPSYDPCAQGGGTSYLYQFDFTSGSSLPNTNGVAGTWLGDSFAVGTGVMQLYSPTNGAGQGGATTRTQMGDGSVRQTGMYTPTGAPVQGRRTSWRELVD